jgi:Membrane-bound lysozyme-inhibitor of c-type lysozyme
MKFKALAPILSAAALISFGAPAAAQGLALNAGTYKCELNQNVQFEKVSSDKKTAVLKWGKKQYAMKAVGTTTGAVRYEDKASGMVWLMAADKSMLLNQKQGQRLADQCNI